MAAAKRIDGAGDVRRPWSVVGQPSLARRSSFAGQGHGRRAASRRRQRGRRLGAEALEKRQVLAVGVALGVPGDGGWLTVIANQGSDVFMQMAATPSNDLFIADNSSFTDRITITGVDGAYDFIHVYGGDSIVGRAFDPIYDPADPAATFGVPIGYPWLNGDAQAGDLFFVCQTFTIDLQEPVTGTLDLNDGSPNDTIYFTNVNPATGKAGAPFFITDGPGAGGQLKYALGSTGGADYSQFTMTFDNDALFGSTVGMTGVPLLSLDYDSDTLGVLPDRVVSSGLGSAVQAPHQFRVFDPATHEYLPGSLKGEVQLEFGPAPIERVSFEIKSTAVGAAVPIVFGSQRVDVANMGAFDWRDDAGQPVGFPPEVLLTGSLNTNTGILSISASTGLADTDFVIGPGGDITEVDVILGQVVKPFSTFVSEFSVGLRDIDPTNNASDPTGLVYDVSANDFTLFPGQLFTRGLVVELANPDSSISIESPIESEFRQTYAAATININAPVRSDDAFIVPDAAGSRFGTVSEAVTINSMVGSPTFDIRLSDEPTTTAIPRTRLVVSQTGSLSNLDAVLERAPETLPFADSIYVEVVDGDIYIEGRIVAEEQSFLVSSPQLEPDDASQVGEYAGFEPYTFTTRSRLTGQDVGALEATTLAIALGNDTIVLPPVPPVSPFVPSTAFAVLDVSTNTSAIRVQASDRTLDPLKQPFPYMLTVREQDDLIIDAVAASSMPIDISADGTIDLLGILDSAGDIRLESTQRFVLGAPIQTRFGMIELKAPQVEIENSVRVLDAVQDDRLTDILIEATAGELRMEDAISGINRVELRQTGPTGITGANRVFADIVEIVAEGNVDARTAASRVFVRSSGAVSIDELDFGVFEIRDAEKVTLVANGFDQIIRGSEAGLATGDTAYTSPALYADVYDTSTLTVSAPNGSVDVYHYGSNTLAVGDVAAIDSGTAVRMGASGSVNIRSSLGSINVFDAPTPTGNARKVRLAATQPLGGQYRANSPGVVPSRIDGVRLTRVNAAGTAMPAPGVDAAYRFSPELDMVDVTTLRLNDQILVLNGGGGRGLAANGVYTIVGLRFPVGNTSYCDVDLVRAAFADTTAELAQKHYVRVMEGSTASNTLWTADGSSRDGSGAAIYEGWGDNNQYRFANVFANNVATVPVQVAPIASRTGYVVAKATTTTPLLTGLSGAIYDHNTGQIRGTGGTFQIPTFNSVDCQLGELVLVRYGASNGAGQIDPRSPGLYQVESVGNGVDSQWVLSRYQGQDDDGDGVLDAFYTGRVAINEGTLRTALTGEMFEISLNSIGVSPLIYQLVTEYGGLETGDFDPVLQYRANVGTNNPTGAVQFIVSTKNGSNDETGAFGRMLALLQLNTAANERTQLPQSQSLTFNATVDKIVLKQELPPIYKPVKIVANRPVLIDGTEIQTSWEGNIVRSGSVSTNIGPLRPTEAKVARRLYRVSDAQTDDRVHGLQILEDADGAQVAGLGFGGFNTGAGIFLQGASSVLIENMTLGRKADGTALANRIGIEVQGPGVEHTTIRGTTVVNSSEIGILLGTGTSEVHVIGNTIGAVGESNTVGLKLASASASPAYVGSASTVLSATVAATGIVESVAALPADTANLLFDINEASQVIKPGMSLYDSQNRIARTVTAVVYVPAATGADAARYRVTVTDASAVGPITGSGRLRAGIGNAFQVGYLAESATAGVVSRPGVLVRGETEIRLPSGINPGDVFLGQEVSAAQSGLFGTSTIVKAIRTVGGTTFLTLSKPIMGTGQGMLLLGTAGPNSVVGNSDGIVIDSNASRLVNTLVTDSIFDGVRVERTDVIGAGKHVLGDSQATVLGAMGQSLVPTTQNLVIHSNQLTGIRFAGSAFAALGAMTGANTAPGGVDPERVADYATIDTFLRDKLIVRGNILGYDPVANANAGNGVTGIDNLIVELNPTDPGYASRQRINFLLLADTTPLNDNGTPTQAADDPVSARLLYNVFTGLDSQFNLYGQGVSGASPGDNTDPTRQPTSPRRPVVRG